LKVKKESLYLMSSTAAPSVQFQRANYIVSSLDEAQKLYCDILGFELAFIKDSAPDSYSYPVFGIDPSKTIRFAVLSAPGQPRCMALTEIQDQDLPPFPEPRRAAIVVQVADFDAVAQKLKAAGYPMFEEQQLKTQDGRIGREQAIQDQDGNLVLIYKITAAPS